MLRCLDETLSVCLWLQGLLALEGELTPILVQMVKSANMNGLLDNDSDSLSGCQHRVKARLHDILQKDCDFVEEDYDRVICSFLSALYKAEGWSWHPIWRLKSQCSGNTSP